MNATADLVMDGSEPSAMGNSCSCTGWYAGLGASLFVNVLLACALVYCQCVARAKDRRRRKDSGLSSTVVGNQKALDEGPTPEGPDREELPPPVAPRSLTNGYTSVRDQGRVPERDEYTSLDAGTAHQLDDEHRGAIAANVEDDRKPPLATRSPVTEYMPLAQGSSQVPAVTATDSVDQYECLQETQPANLYTGLCSSATDLAPNRQTNEDFYVYAVGGPPAQKNSSLNVPAQIKGSSTPISSRSSSDLPPPRLPSRTSSPNPSPPMPHHSNGKRTGLANTPPVATRSSPALAPRPPIRPPSPNPEPRAQQDSKPKTPPRPPSPNPEPRAQQDSKQKRSQVAERESPPAFSRGAAPIPHIPVGGSLVHGASLHVADDLLRTSLLGALPAIHMDDRYSAYLLQAERGGTDGSPDDGVGDSNQRSTTHDDIELPPIPKR